LAARIGPTPGSTWDSMPVILGAPFSLVVSKVEENEEGLTSNE